MRLRDEMDRLAAEESQVPDVEQVIRSARRRQAMRRASIPAAAAVIAAVALTGPQWWRGAGDSERQITPPSPAPTTHQPRDITPPATAARLPADRPVGTAAFAYTSGERAYLVTTDGAQYAASSDAFGAGAVSLSPDGRWYLEGKRLRDLTTTNALDIPYPTGIRAWSPDGRWLLIDSDGSQRLIEVATGRVQTPHTAGFGVLDTGELLVLNGSAGAGRSLTLQVVDQTNGTVRRQVTIDAAEILPPGASLVGQYGEGGISVRAAAGSAARIMIEVRAATPTVIAVVASLRDGKVISLVEPPTTPGVSWYPFGLVGDAVFARGLVAQPSATAAPSPVVLALLPLAGGKPITTYRLAPGATVLAPGATYTV